jgi:hypothetical protein
MTVLRNFDWSEREPRFKVLAVSADVLLDLVLAPRRIGDRIRALTVEGLPDGAEIQAVSYSDFDRLFFFRIWHPSFDPVSESHATPRLHVQIRMEELRVADAPQRGREFI